MWCAFLSPLHLETHFVHTVPWNDVPLLFKCSPKSIIMSVRRPDKYTLAVIVHTISSVKIAKDGQSGTLMPFGVKKQTSTVTACGIANIFYSYIIDQGKNAHYQNQNIRFDVDFIAKRNVQEVPQKGWKFCMQFQYAMELHWMIIKDASFHPEMMKKTVFKITGNFSENAFM